MLIVSIRVSYAQGIVPWTIDIPLGPSKIAGDSIRGPIYLPHGQPHRCEHVNIVNFPGGAQNPHLVRQIPQTQ